MSEVQGSHGLSSVPISSMEELNVYVTEYLSIHQEQQSIRAELQRIKQTFKERLQPLIERMEYLEKAITDFLKRNNLPGIRKDGSSVYLLKKPVFLSKEKRIRDFFHRVQERPINPETMAVECLQALKSRSVNNDEFTMHLKILKKEK